MVQIYAIGPWLLALVGIVLCIGSFVIGPNGVATVLALLGGGILITTLPEAMRWVVCKRYIVPVNPQTCTARVRRSNCRAQYIRWVCIFFDNCPDKLTGVVDIKAGEDGELMLFSRTRIENLKRPRSRNYGNRNYPLWIRVGAVLPELEVVLKVATTASNGVGGICVEAKVVVFADRFLGRSS